MIRCLFTIFFVLFCLMFQNTKAEIPHTLSYQGVLTDTLGNPKPDGNYNFTFCIYSSSTGGNAHWSESKTLPTKRGLFYTALGDQNAFPDSLIFDREYWLGIQIGTEPELTPRIKFNSVAYSFRAIYADSARHIIITAGSIDSSGLAANSVTTDKILDGTIKGIDIEKPLILTDALSSAIMQVNNTGTGDGIRVSNPTGLTGFLSTNSGGDGFQASYAGANGLAVYRSLVNGVWIHDVDANGVHINKAGTSGFTVDSTGGNGLLVLNSGYNGVAVHNAGTNGIMVLSAGENGIYATGNNCAGYFDGNFVVANGTKSAAVKVDAGDWRLVYCQESPELWFEDFGEGQLQNGKSHIDLEPVFYKTVTISLDHPIKVFVQLQDDCNGVYVRKGNTGFDVIELQNGTSNARFSYRVVAKRKGYENFRLRRMEAGTNPEELEAKHAKERLTIERENARQRKLQEEGSREELGRR